MCKSINSNKKFHKSPGQNKARTNALTVVVETVAVSEVAVATPAADALDSKRTMAGAAKDAAPAAELAIPLLTVSMEQRALAATAATLDQESVVAPRVRIINLAVFT